MESTDNADLRAIHQLSMVINVAETLLEELTLANTELVINADLSKQDVAINSEPSKEQLGLNLTEVEIEKLAKEYQKAFKDTLY